MAETSTSSPAGTWGRTMCPYCGVGCGLLVRVDGGRVTKVKGDPDHPANFGDVCAKAVHLPPALLAPDRLLHPEIRSRRDVERKRVPWELALRFTAERWREIFAAHGPDAVAFYASGQLLTEEYYVAGKLAKGFIGTNNFDTNSRLCMASAAVGYTRSLGADGPPAAYEDIDSADCFLLIGTNTADCHPIVWKRIRRRKLSAPDRVSVIVVDPRWTETADIADLHLPLRPGSDIALLNGMLHVLWKDGLIDRAFVGAHTSGWEKLRHVVERYTPERVSALTGLSRDIIVTAALRFASASCALTLWSMGINQSHVGTDKNAAIINLHLATGQIGRPGAGPFSLTGQPNAMGGRETGGLAHLLPGYRAITDVHARDLVERHWGAARGSIRPRRGRSALEIFDGLARGDVRAVWIIGTNPAASVPDTDLVEKALRQADLVVVQDAYHPTETTRFADVLLPAAQWPEKDGVMTSSERRLTYLSQLVDPPGEALPDAVILTRFAHEMGFKQAFPYTSAAEIFDEFAALTAGTPCDYSGVTHARLRTEGPLQWPVPSSAHSGTPRLYVDGRFPTSDGRARFIAVEHDPPVEPPDRAYPLVLTTGRVRDHWHTLTRTGKVPALRRRTPEPILEVNVRDARRLGLLDGGFVEITSRRGKVIAQCRVTETIREGVCFLPFHWGRSFGFYKSANNLTLGARDELSGQPELKVCAVRLRAVESER
ncbi:MAG: nitrate reductase catalytic subunit [Candidatus Rokuibacteriota bacterium]|nr:MAG: nitrate reductase catalytic subunit [Candidatus Rokubacteria bacterium]